MRVVALSCLAFAFAGCGVLDDEGPALPARPDPAVYGPPAAIEREQPDFPAPELAEPTAGVARELDAGAVGVVDLTGTVAIEPRMLVTASDQTLEDVEWSRWDAGGAEGRGRLRALTCQPTCAGGGAETVAARIVLEGVKTCDGRRYYERGELLVDPRPATYLRAPC